MKHCLITVPTFKKRHIRHDIPSTPLLTTDYHFKTHPHYSEVLTRSKTFVEGQKKFFKFAVRFNFLLVVIWAASRSEQRDAPSNIQLQAAQAARKKSQDPTQQTFNVNKEATGNQG
jgi:hypothetical protein